MDTRKVLGIIFSILFVGAFTFVLCWGIINFNKVKEGMSGTGVYTQEDINNAYQDGYNTALEDKTEYDELINGYRDTITTLNDNISQLNSQINSLQNKNKDCELQINKLTATKENLEQEVENLNTNKLHNEKTIDALNLNIASLNSQIVSLNNTISTNETTIEGLNIQIKGLNTQIAGLNQIVSTNDITINDLRIRNNELSEEIVKLSNSINNKETEINLLKNEILANEEQIASLVNQNNDYIDTISSLEFEVSKLRSEKETLILENTNYYNTISSLNNQIVNLQNINSQLENTNLLHLSTISSLNSQITNLNEQISNITYSSDVNNKTIISLNEKITDLENSIKYYENYIASLESNEQIVITFEFDGSVYNIQMINKGNTVAVTTPTSTDYIVFNGWKVGDEIIDLETYSFVENTKVVADITYNYDVIFKVDENVYNSQIVEKNNCPIVPVNPTKDGYEFDGWTVDNVNIINVSSNQITSNTTYKAVFTKLHTVTFIYEDITRSTQTIRNGNYATSISVDNTTYKVFNGWKVNGNIVNVETYKITSDTIFVADITYKYDVIYKVDGVDYDTQIVTSNNYPTLPTNPVKEGYEFDGWSLNGTDIINTSTIQITSNTTYFAVFTKLYKVSFVYEGNTISSQLIRNGERSNTVNVENTTYKIFNGWKVDNSFVNINNYIITKDTTFVADITYRYDVVYKVNNEVYNSQIIEKGNYASSPVNPTIDGYAFDGWTLNGTDIINVNNVAINSNTTFIAKFTKLHAVTFVYESATHSIQIIRNGENPTNVDIASTDYKVFNGWTLNGTIVSVSSQTITSDTTFVASITYKHKVNYIVDDVVSSQFVVNNEYSSVPSNPTKSGYAFDGWSTNGSTIVNPSAIRIVSDTNFTAVFTKLHTVTFVSEGSTVSTQTIRNNEYATNVSVSQNTYKVFNGWKYNNQIVNLSTYKITQDITFTADFTYKYDVVFMVDNSQHSKQIIAKNSYASLPSNPSKQYYVFKGWSLDGKTVISNITSIPVTKNTTYYAVFENTRYLIYTDYSNNKYYIDVSGYSEKKLYWSNLNCPITKSQVKAIEVPTFFTSLGSFNSASMTNFESISIPYTITSIDDYCFGGCAKLTSVDLSSVTNIGQRAFKDCDNLTSVILNKDVVFKDFSSTFSDCNNLTITYLGTMAEWKAIMALDSFSNSFKVNCTDGSLTYQYGELV